MNLGLTGLSPEDISRAFQLELGRQDKEIARQRTELERERLGISKYQSETSRYTALTKDERTAAIKNFEYYKTKQGGTKSFDRWNEGLTKERRLYDEAIKSGMDPKTKFHDWLFELKKSGATRISLGEKVDTAEALGDVKERQRLTSFEFREEIDKEVEKEIKDSIDYGLGTDAERSNIRDMATARKMETRLKASRVVKSINAERRSNGEIGWVVTTKDDETLWVRFK